MPGKSDAKMPSTPTVRRFLAHVFRPLPQVLRKRNRDEGDDATPDMQGLPVDRPACVALQNEDTDEDAVIITALHVVPFCCHADLLTMSRPELLVVAETLNAKLPRVLQIDVAPTRSDAFIRTSVELLVGIRKDVPLAPKPIKSLPSHVPRVLQSPGSPLALKNRTEVSMTSPALAALQEEDEDPVAEPPQKKRRFDADKFFGASPSPTQRLMRSQSHRVAPVSISTPTRLKPTVPRTQSQRIPQRRPVLQGIHPNVNTTRGHTGSRAMLGRFRDGAVVTSTPKKPNRGRDGAAAKSGIPGPQPASARTPSRAASSRDVERALKRKLSDAAMDGSEMTFDIEGLTIPGVSMDVDPID